MTYSRGVTQRRIDVDHILVAAYSALWAVGIGALAWGITGAVLQVYHLVAAQWDWLQWLLPAGPAKAKGGLKILTELSRAH